MVNQMNPCKRIQGVCCLCDDTSTYWWLQFQSMQAIHGTAKPLPEGATVTAHRHYMVLHHHVSVTLLLRSNPICYAAATSVISTLRFGVTLYYRPSTCYTWAVVRKHISYYQSISDGLLAKHLWPSLVASCAMLIFD